MDDDLFFIPLKDFEEEINGVTSIYLEGQVYKITPQNDRNIRRRRRKRDVALHTKVKVRPRSRFRATGRVEK